uniref:PAN domain containing protein, putative n=1 Tax=Neospora caninum (strain Liverpool) TaxID=572307 RepID=A0A0F7U4M4_NEOCL|nr:TPA: PAN domain containing protein, putative [Neospora caninum Liverpool]
MEPSSAEDVPYPIVSNPRRRPRRMIGHGDVAIVFIVLAATLASPSLCDRAINYEDQRSTDGGNRHRSASVEGRRYQEEYAPRMLSGPASESSDPNPTARELAQQLLQELYKRDVVLTNRQILQVLPSLLPQVEALGLDAAEFEDEFRSLLATRVGVSQKTAEQSRGPLSQRKITKVPRRDLNDPARYTENKPRSSTVARQEGNSHKLDEENRFSIRDREYPAFIPTPELRGFGTPTPAPLMKQSEGITNEYTEELPEETDVLAGETAKLGEEEELDGQQLFQLWKKANRRQRTVNKDFDLVVGGDELLRVRATTYKRTGPAPSTGTDVTVVPLVAASFDAPGESALTLVQAFNGEPGELRRMFAEAVIDSIPGRLKYLWNVSESDVRLFSIQDNDISVYLNTTNIVHRPEPMSTPLSFTPGCNFTRSLTDQTQIGTSSTPCVRIQWDLLDSIGRGEIGTTELVEAVNADLMSQTNSHILGRQSEFGRRAGTVLGNVIRVARSAYSISGAPVKDQPTGPNAGQCFKRGVDFYGFDVKKLEAGEIHTAGECAEHCKFVDTCYYWTFNQARRWCYLKNAYAPEGLHSDSTATKDLISGLKNCNVLPDPYPSEPCYLVGVDILTAKTGYTRVITSSSSALQCHAECVMDPYCFYWTYKSYQRFCVLKGRDLVDVTSGQQAANQGETSTTDGLISGAKRCKTNQAIDRHVRRLMEVDDSELSQDLCYQPGIEFNLSRDHVVREETAVYSPEQCDLLCAAELGCVSWTYKFKTKRCFLLASDAHTAKRVVGESPDGPAGEEEAALSGLFGARHCIGASSSQLGEPLQSSESTPATGKSEGSQQETSLHEADQADSGDKGHPISEQLPACAKKGFMYEGHDLDIGSENPSTTPSAHDCWWKCSRTQLCFFWTYDKKTAKCFLKDVNAATNSRFTRRETFASGPRFCPNISASHRSPRLNRRMILSGGDDAPSLLPSLKFGSSFWPAGALAELLGTFSMNEADGGKTIKGTQPKSSRRNDQSSARDGLLNGLPTGLVGNRVETQTKENGVSSLISSWFPFSGFRMGTGGGFLARDEKNRDKHLQGKNPGAIRQDAVAQNGASPKQVKEQPTSKENAAEPTASPLRHTDTLSSPVSGNDKERNKHMEMAGPDVTTNDAHVTKGNKHDDHGDRGTRAGIGTRDDVRGSQTNTQPPNTIREKVPLHLDAYRTREDETKIGGTTDTNAIGQSAPCEREGVALTGGDFFAIGDPGADTGTAQGIVMQNSQQCAAYCAASVGCTFWTMDKESGLCYLKTAAALSTYKRDDTTKNFVSGSVTAGSDCLL